jgi:hypothetical protein
MNNLIKQIIKSVVIGASERAGCCDDDTKLVKKLNKLVDSENKKDHKRLVRALGKLADCGIDLKDI